MIFKLSEQTLETLNMPTTSGQRLSTKQLNYYNSKEFYRRQQDLAPRNVYLIEGRVVDMKTVKRTIQNFGATPIEKFCNWFNNKYVDFKTFLVKCFRD